MSIIVSRHVRFFEHIIPYHEIKEFPTKSLNPTSDNLYTFLHWLSISFSFTNPSQSCSSGATQDSSDDSVASPESSTIPGSLQSPQNSVDVTHSTHSLQFDDSQLHNTVNTYSIPESSVELLPNIISSKNKHRPT